MKKRILKMLSVLSLSALVLAGCDKEVKVEEFTGVQSKEVEDIIVADSSENNNESASTTSEEKKESPYNYISSFENKLLLYGKDCSMKTIELFEKVGSMYLDSYYEDAGNIFYVVTDYENDRKRLYRINDSLTPELVEEGFVTDRDDIYGFYKGDFYHFSYSSTEGDKIFEKAVCYEADKEFTNTEKSIPLLETIGSNNSKYMQDCLENLDKYGVVQAFDWDQRCIEIYDADGELVKTVKPVEDMNMNWCYSDKYVAFYAGDIDYYSDDDTREYFWYDLEAEKLHEMPELKANNYMGFHSIVGNDLYYFADLGDSSVCYKNELRKYSFSNSEDISIFEEGKRPGVEFYNGEVFNTRNVKINGNTGNFLLNTETGKHLMSFDATCKNTAVELGDAIISRDTSEYGYNTAYFEQFRTEDDQKRVYEYYCELFQFTKDYPGKDRMNEILKAAVEQSLQYYKEAGENAISEYDPDFVLPASYNTDGFLSVKEIGDTLVAIETSGYEYAGGAHGYPTWNQYAFNRTTGELITLEQIYKGTEEEFKTIVANYSLEDYLINTDKYFEVESTQDLYNNFFEYARLDMFTMFDDEDLLIIYTPYEYGPYSSGYIIVRIPYEELGFDFKQE